MNLTLIKRLLEAKSEANTELDKKTNDGKSEGGSKKVVDPAKDKPIAPEKKKGEVQQKADTERNPDGSLKAEIPTGGKTLTGEPANKVDMDPSTVSKINEAKNRCAVVTFGRMNPPTIGHEALVDTLIKIAKKRRATPLVFLSRTQDKKKNPIPYLKKLQYARRAFGDIVQPTPADASSVFGILAYIQDEYDDVVLVVGSDRVAELKAKVAKYNGKDFKFNSIEVQSAGERDPDDGDVAGASASKMRKFAQDGMYQQFVDGLPEKLRGISLQVFRSVQLEEGFVEPGITNQAQLLEQADLAMQRVEEDYQLTESEFRSLYDKSEESGFPLEILESSYKRGVHAWQLTETILDHQQFSFNRVNAMLNGGSTLDDDLFEGYTGDIILPIELAQPEKTDKKAMHRTKVRPGRAPKVQIIRKILEHIQEDAIPGIKDGKGVRRVDMPQISDFDAFTKDLEANGTPMVEPKAYKASALTPIQKHFNQEKVDLMKKEKSAQKPIIISSDHKIVDGHHRWMAAKQMDGDVHARKVDMKHDDLLDFLKDKPYVVNKKLHEDAYDVAEKHRDLARQHPVGSSAHHRHMSNYHEHISEWHRTKGRWNAADRAAAKAERHHEAAVAAKS